MSVTKQLILDNIKADDRWLYRGILAIYRGQTDDEQRRGVTVEDNGIGFNGSDAPFMSSLAKQVLSGRKLSQKQCRYARTIMYKYADQLLKIASCKE
jgi:hypothetical protein